MSRMLIVEDNALFRQSLKSILCRRFPFMDVGESAGGKEVLQKIDLRRPDLIFMDIKLPGESGLELTRKIKTDHPTIIIIILTSYDLPEYREAAREHGADYFLSKGSSTGEEILALVESILSGADNDFDGLR